MDMRLGMVVATAIAGLAAPGMGDVRLMAQETPQELTGCHGLTVGPWVVETYYEELCPRESLEERLRGQYGAPGARSGVPNVHIYRSASTSLWLRPSAAGAAEILLSDRGR